MITTQETFEIAKTTAKPNPGIVVVAPVASPLSIRLPRLQLTVHLEQQLHPPLTLFTRLLISSITHYF
ncbi:unnamed protein product [Periconia digitata]|uniref:Uncharacterized protein n=1 Tax=Periconia digitata TaxID=1303443 RepID=A0A9W4XQ09_9PLEO|nr:unnamed protein product [Periconia digitata]